jgi:hypothetical protein
MDDSREEAESPRARQARFNAGSRDQWAGFQGHRARVSAVLGAGSEPRPSRLCVLGAGNTNDLDLPSLLKVHREVHLVDLDPVALEAGAFRQGVGNEPRLHLHGGVDVTAMIDAFARWSPLEPVARADLEALVDWPSRRVPLTLPGPFDLVASTCLLSQIVGNAFVALGDHHAQLDDAVAAIRLGHLRLLTELARPGGRVALISDVVNSERVPELLTWPEPALPDFLHGLAAKGNTIRGMNPSKLMGLFRRDPVLASKIADVEVPAPWRWRLYRRVYLVWASLWRIG